ncbi:MAG: hypothetical protein HOW73_22665 [Polyangiaceae bacterium]|nr:hypothetical protein [Polyangiaceae bacterium]
MRTGLAAVRPAADWLWQNLVESSLHVGSVEHFNPDDLIGHEIEDDKPRRRQREACVAGTLRSARTRRGVEARTVRLTAPAPIDDW